MSRACPKCGGPQRMGVSLFLDLPLELEHLLSKKNLRRADVKLMGAGWDRAYFYCEKGCGWAVHLSEPAPGTYEGRPGDEVNQCLQVIVSTAGLIQSAVAKGSAKYVALPIDETYQRATKIVESAMRASRAVRKAFKR